MHWRGNVAAKEIQEQDSLSFERCRELAREYEEKEVP